MKKIIIILALSSTVILSHHSSCSAISADTIKNGSTKITTELLNQVGTIDNEAYITGTIEGKDISLDFDEAAFKNNPPMDKSLIQEKMNLADAIVSATQSSADNFNEPQFTINSKISTYSAKLQGRLAELAASN